MEHKKYWIKLEKDFLNSSQIKVIKNMPNGKDYIIFYLALMLESTNTEGHLRFSELVPYNEQMLASVTDTNVDIVRSALQIFETLGMVQILENGTLFLPDVPKRVGKECDSAERVRLYRENQRLLQCNTDVTKCNDNKDKDKDKDKDNIGWTGGGQMSTVSDTVANTHRFVTPSIDEVRAYCLERKNNVDAERFVNFYASKGWMVGKNKMRDWKACVRTWERESAGKQAGERKYTSAELDGLFDNVDDLEI